MKALVIGESLVDIVEQDGSEPVEHPGGSPANVAIGLARLGREVELLTWLGEDDRGSRVRANLEASNVVIASGSQNADHTSTAIATLAEDGSATYVFDLTIDYPDYELTSEIGVVHVGSIGAMLAPGAEKAIALLAKAREQAVITYDPNLRPSIMGEREAVREQVLALVAQADVVKVSDEDLAWFSPEEDPLDVALEWLSLGPALVVVTLGGDGSVAVSAGGSEARVAAPTVTVADTVGAGDSFMGGLIDGLWSAGLLGAGMHDSIGELTAPALTTLLAQAARIAAITVSRPGANPPTRLELLTVLED